MTPNALKAVAVSLAALALGLGGARAQEPAAILLPGQGAQAGQGAALAIANAAGPSAPGTISLAPAGASAATPEVAAPVPSAPVPVVTLSPAAAALEAAGKTAPASRAAGAASVAGNGEGAKRTIPLPAARPSAAPAGVDVAQAASSASVPTITLLPSVIATEEGAALPQPMTRDSASGAEENGEAGEALAGWLLSPMPLGGLPREVGIGASLPQPGILRLTGEVAQTELTLDLPAGALPPQSLHLTYRSSVNILPDVARMQVQINEDEPAEITLDRLTGFSTVEIETKALMPGSNRIRISLRQPHRIFCGPDSSFAVWTEIDLAQSGAKIAPEALTVDATGFALAAQAQIAGGRALPLLVNEDADLLAVRRVIEQVSEVLGPRGHVELRPFYSLGPQPMASIALIPSKRAATSFRRGATGAIVLQVEVPEDSEVPDLEPMLFVLAQMAEDAEQGEKPATVPKLTPARKTTLAELGARDIIGNTRYFRHDVAFDLPSDWLLLANQKARFNLHYGYAKSLPEGATLLVKINGITIHLLPMDRKGGEILPMLQIPFDANNLRPGRNQLTFEMMVPGNPETEICPPRRSDLLVILADSNITVPPSPAMVQPGMAAVLAGLEPAAIQAADGVSDRSAMDRAALRLAAQMQKPKEPNPEVSLQLITLSDLGLLPSDGTRLSRRQIEKVMFDVPEFSIAEEERLTLAKPDDITPLAEPKPRGSASFRLSEDDEPIVIETATSAGEEPGLWERASNYWRSFSLRDWLRDEYLKFRERALPGERSSLTDWLSDQEGRALLLRPEGDRPNDLWLVLGPDLDPGEAGRALQKLREEGSALGEAAVLRHDGSWQVWSPIKPPILLEKPNLRNMRGVLGNYASWSPMLFTLVMLALALLSIVPAILYVLLTRRSRIA